MGILSSKVSRIALRAHGRGRGHLIGDLHLPSSLLVAFDETGGWMGDKGVFLGTSKKIKFYADIFCGNAS